MKLQVTQENLNQALGTVARVANSRGTLPILANILLQVTDNRLSLSATNLDIAVKEFVGAKISKPGSITVPARLMQDFVSSLPSGVIEMELVDNKLKISSDQYKSIINGVPADDFPTMPVISDGTEWKISGKSLREGLSQVIMAASSDDTRPILTGVYVNTDKKSLYLAATDSYRLAEKRLNTSSVLDDMKLLVPVSAMQDLLRILSDYNEDIDVINNEQQVQFTVGDTSLVSRLIDGNYPPYRNLIPAKFATTVKVNRQDFLNITKVSSLFARESAGSVTIDVSEENQTLEIHSIASQLGENTSSVSGKITGEGSITLNSRYLSDALHAIKDDEVEFCFNGKLEATLLKGNKSDDYLHIIMPLKS